MTLHYISKENTPNYTALSTDIVNNKITGASNVGNTVYLTDTQQWMIIEFDLSLVNYGNSIKNSYTTALGRDSGMDDWNKWGYNADVDVGTETVWASGGTFTMLTTASTISIVSDSASDTLLGVGAQSVTITGIDANFVYQTESFDMEGVTPVVSLTTWLGINRVSISAGGTTGYNVGNITVTAVTGGSIQAFVPLVGGITQQAIFHSQAGQVVLLDWVLLNIAKVVIGTTPVVTIKCMATDRPNNVRYEIFRHIVDTAVENTVELNMKHPFSIGEKSLIEWTATTDKADTAVSVRFSFVEALI